VLEINEFQAELLETTIRRARTPIVSSGHTWFDSMTTNTPPVLQESKAFKLTFYVT